MIKMPFGKHKGLPLSRVPIDYVRWLNKQTWLPGPLKQTVSKFLNQAEVAWSRAVRDQVGPPPFEPGTFWEGTERNTANEH